MEQDVIWGSFIFLLQLVIQIWRRLNFSRVLSAHEVKNMCYKPVKSLIGVEGIGMNTRRE